MVASRKVPLLLDRHLDFVAEAFGWRAEQVTSADDLESTLEVLVKAEGPTLIDYRIPTEEDAPDFILARRRATSARK